MHLVGPLHICEDAEFERTDHFNATQLYLPQSYHSEQDFIKAELSTIYRSVEWKWIRIVVILKFVVIHDTIECGCIVVWCDSWHGWMKVRMLVFHDRDKILFRWASFCIPRDCKLAWGLHGHNILLSIYSIFCIPRDCKFSEELRIYCRLLLWRLY